MRHLRFDNGPQTPFNERMRGKKWGYILLSLIITLVLLWLLSSQIKAADFIQTLRRIHIPFLLAFIALSLVNTGLRALRYQWLLLPRAISFGHIFLVTLVRNLFVDLLPARSGSLSYIYVLNSRLDFPFESATSSFVLAFVFDFLTLSPFLIAAIFFVGTGTGGIPVGFLMIVSLIFFLIFLLIYLRIVRIGNLGLRGLRFLVKRFHLKEGSTVQLIETKWKLTLEALKRIKASGIDWPLIWLSLGIRLAKYGSLTFLLASLLHSHGFKLKNISFWKTILGITGAELTSILPIKGLGGFGTWETAWSLTFKLMKFEPRLAVLSGLGIHLLSNLLEYTLGLAAVLILALPLIRNARNRNGQREP